MLRSRPAPVFVGALALCSIAIAAIPVPNPSFSDLSGSFRLNARNLIDEDQAQTDAVDLADQVMGAEYGKFSKALKKAAKPMDRMDKAFGDDQTYNEQADFFVSLCALTTGVQLGHTANSALLDELLRDPIRFSKVVQKNNRVVQQINEDDARSKINKAKSRKKKLVVISKVAKYFEKLVKKYGRNNDT